MRKNNIGRSQPKRSAATSGKWAKHGSGAEWARESHPLRTNKKTWSVSSFL